jgi:hypothetical protein
MENFSPTIKKQLSSPHPEIVKHRDAIKKAKAERYYSGPIIDIQGLHIRRQAILDTCSVSEHIMQKAYVFLDALMKAIEKSGGVVEVTQERSCFVIEGERIFFRLKEKYNKVPNPSYSPKDFWGHRYNLESSGFLKVIIGYENVRGSSYPEPSHEFKENETNSLDKVIKDVYAYILKQPQRVKEDRVEYQKCLAEQKQEQNEKMQLAELHSAELKKTKELVMRAKQYELSQITGQYIDSLRASGCSDEYIKWAEEKAKWLNPTSGISDPILDETDKTALVEDEKEPKTSWHDQLIYYPTHYPTRRG